MSELRPCPFCGAKLELKKGWYPRDNSDAYVHPSNGCILSNFSTYDGFPTAGESVELWNKRSTEEVAQRIGEALKNSKGMFLCPSCAHKDVCKFAENPEASCDKFLNAGTYERYGNIYSMFDPIFDWLKFHYPHGEVYFVVENTRARMYQEHGPYVSDRETRGLTGPKLKPYIPDSSDRKELESDE